MKRRQAGFTIIELVVVIIVILVLLGVVLATRAGVATKERNTERQRDVAELRSNLEAYYAQHDEYPTLKEVNSQEWRSANMKGLDEEALRDPLQESTYDLSATANATTYSYAVTAANGSACDDAKTPCTQYSLSAQLEGAGRYTKNNLN